MPNAGVGLLFLVLCMHLCLCACVYVWRRGFGITSSLGSSRDFEEAKEHRFLCQGNFKGIE